MIDFGPTALMALRRYGVAPAQLGGVVFTHLHGDHTGGFPLLCIEAMFGGWPASRLQVLGPPLTDRSLREVFDAAYRELTPELPDRLELLIEEFAPGEARQFVNDAHQRRARRTSRERRARGRRSAGSRDRCSGK